MTSETERRLWTDWLASVGYGIDYSGQADPPCTLTELAAAYLRITGEESVDDWEWCITENTGAFTTSKPTNPAATTEETES